MSKDHSLEGNVYKIGIVEAKSRYIWMTKAESKKVDGMLEQWLKDTIPWMRAQHGLKAFQFQTLPGPSGGSRWKLGR